MQTQVHRAALRSSAVLGTLCRASRQFVSSLLFLTFVRRYVTSSGLLLLGLLLSLALPLARAQTPLYNYAEALQKSLYFFDEQKSGPGITGGRIQWRGDSELTDTHLSLVPVVRTSSSFPFGVYLSQAFIDGNRTILDPDRDGSIDVSGGFHDSGDHVRFGLPQAYAASTLAWSFFEFRDAFVQTGQRDHVVEELRWFADCFLRCTFRNAVGDVVAFCYDVGDPAVDRQYWGSPELQSATKYPRPAYFATAQTPASDQAAAHAAALAAIGVVLQPIDAPYAARCIEAARALYRFATTNRGGLGFGDVFYHSSYDDDDLAWAAVWLFQATGNSQYLRDIESVDAVGQYNGYLKRIIFRPADDWKNTSVYSWDMAWGGVFLRLAALTNNPRYLAHARWNAEYWSGLPHQDPADTSFLSATPAGFRILARQGASNGSNCAAQFCTLVFRKYTGRTDFTDWARGQMNYIMGSNPMKRSYIVGFPTLEASVQHPHHRAAHGSTTNDTQVPRTHRHVLWGALVPGPNSEDLHRDETAAYPGNNAAIDLNASLVGALAGLYTYYGAGQKPLAAFPPTEPPVRAYFVEAKVGTETTQTTVTLRVHAEPIHPPQLERGLSARYFFDISEMIAAGQSIADVSAGSFMSADGETDTPVLRGPIAWDGGSVYYIEVDWTDREIYGTRTFQFILRPKADPQGTRHWSTGNDWGRRGLSTVFTLRPNVPLYRNGVLAFGQEPPKTSTPNFALWTTPAEVTVIRASSAVSNVLLFQTRGFSDSVSLSISGLPTGVTASFATPVTRSGSALFLNASPTATPGLSTVVINATSALGIRSTALELTVSPIVAPDFSLSAPATGVAVRRRNSATTTIDISRTLGFADPVALEVTELPAGVRAIFSPNPATGTTSTLTVFAESTAPLGSSRVTILGRNPSNVRIHEVGMDLAVMDPITFACSTPPTAITFPFLRDGPAELCLVTSGTITSINSRGMQLVEINGVNITNIPVVALPPRVNGNYYIHSVGNVPMSRLDIMGAP